MLRFSKVFSWFLHRFAIGYALAILPDKYFNFEWKTPKIPMFSPDSCTVLLGYPLAILREKCLNFQLKTPKIPMFSLLILHGFARLPTLYQYCLKNARAFRTKTEIFSFFPWFLHGFARLPLAILLEVWSNFNEKHRKFTCFLLISARFCWATP